MDSTATTSTERFADLFAGRTDAYGTEQGGCYRPNRTFDSMVTAHLSGAESPIGVYPLVPFGDDEQPLSWLVKWGCVDLDVKGPTHATGYDTTSEALAAAMNLQTALHHFGIQGWIESTRSHGWHVWVFADEWVPARVMRRALLVACAVADVPPSEVNPKSEGFDSPDVLGNYVRLPYPGSDRDSRFMVHRIMLDADERGGTWTAIPLEDFVFRASNTRASSDRLQALADLYVPPIDSVDTLSINGDVELDESLRRRLSGLTWTILSEGPLEGHDRSGTLFRLAVLCKQDDLDPDEAFAVVKAADEVWGKFSRRPNGDRYLKEIVEKAWNV